MILSEIAGLISSEIESEEITENNSEYIGSFELKSILEIDSTTLSNYLERIPERDSIDIKVSYEHQEDIYLNNSELDDINTFIENLSNHESFKEEKDTLFINVRILKGESNNCKSIYSLDSIAKFWSKTGLINSFKKIQDISQFSKTFRVYDLDKTVRTSEFLFTPFNSLEMAQENNEKHEVLEKRNSSCHFSNSSNLDFTPTDFNLEVKSEFNIFDSLFDNLKSFSSLFFLCNFSKIKGSEYALFRIEGYKNYEEIFNRDNKLTTNNNAFYNIFKWAYTDGSVSDKLDLARNIISLHIVDNSLLNIEDSTLSAIISSHRIYLKENVKQYIEVKNKLSEFIQDSSNKASEIAKSTGTYFKNSIWTLYSFFASIILFRILAKNDGGVLISNEILLFFIGFSSITLLIMRHALGELTEDKLRLKKNYYSMKNRYLDILEVKDLDNILNNDDQHLDDMKFLDNKTKAFRELWGYSLAMLTIIVLLIWLAKM